MAHLFVRDPLVIFEDRIDLDNGTEMDHFENIQSTNWNTVRFKPPHPDSDIGWRTEFRSMEVGTPPSARRRYPARHSRVLTPELRVAGLVVVDRSR